ncbi:MAG: hypothetical protein SXQ77_11345, partial [Halobacteria archaeon]|nr:hypothetical protein [Halobacteria archaeon]
GDSIAGFDDDEYRRFATALIILASKNENAKVDAIEEITGDVYNLPRMTVKDAHSLTRYLETCGKSGKAGLGLSLCVSENGVDEARKTYRTYQSSLIKQVRNAEVSGGVVRIDGDFDTGSVADIYENWLLDTPLLVVNDEGKASMRARG